MQTESTTARQTATVQEVTTDSSATAKTTDTRHTRLGTETLTERTEGEEVVTTIREYDTSLPADTATGTPPLRREITQTRRKAGTARQVQATVQTSARNRETETQAARQRTDHRAEQTDTRQHDTATAQVAAKEKRGTNTLQRILCFTGAFAILALLGWGWRKLKRIYKPF